MTEASATDMLSESEVISFECFDLFCLNAGS